MQPFLFIALFIVVIGGLTAYSFYASHKRQQALMALASQLGLMFAPDAGGVEYKYEGLGFTPFGRGNSRRSSNLIHGPLENLEWEIFDYRFTTGSGKNRTTHHYGIVAARIGVVLPQLQIRPEGFFDKLVEMTGFGGGDINFESEQFSRRYHVSGSDRRKAYDVMHPQMIEYMLALPAMHWQMKGDVLTIVKRGRFDAPELSAVMRAMGGFVERIPEYVRQDARLRL